MRAVVVIPTLNACGLLAEAVASIEAQTVPVEIIVVDNASTRRDAGDACDALSAGDGRPKHREPRLRARRESRCRRGWTGRGDHAGQQRRRVPSPISSSNLLEPFADASVGMVAGVLLQGSAPELIDSAGIELDTTLRSWDMLVEPAGGARWLRRPSRSVRAAARPRIALRRIRRSSAASTRRFFAYWEDVDLALRFRARRLAVRPRARRARPAQARATLGAASPRPAAAGGVRPRATCSRSTAWAAAARCTRRRSQRSTGRCSPSTSSCGGRRARARERLRARSLGLRRARSPSAAGAGHDRLRDGPPAAVRPAAPAVRRRAFPLTSPRRKQRRLTYGSVHGSEIETARPFASSIHSTR